MRFFGFLIASTFALTLGLGSGSASGQVCDLAANGTFRFLNDAFPQGTQNAEYVARLVVVNADGPVSFSVAGSGDPLPSGLTLDASSGVITGLPTGSGNDDVDFVANDGTQLITQTINIKISASGGGGNGGAEVSNNVFPDGRVGTAYSHTATVTNGVGPFTFGGSDLPPGLALSGSTGTVSGVPTTPGTYFASLTVYDAGEDNIGETVLPITILPALSDFRFLTQFLSNGEVGTPYCDQYEVENAVLVVTYGVSGLPPGLSLDPLTGSVSGTPATAGTYLVSLSANDGVSTIIANLSVVIAPGASSAFHWNLIGLPAGLVNTLYDRQPAIAIPAEGAVGAIAYAADGLPAGITYGASTGELSGTPTRVGEYPVVLTASDGGSSETLTLSLIFIVLPATGGDVNQISVNLWVTKASLRVGEDGSESLGVSAIYNADRRTDNRFDPTTDTFKARLGGRELRVDPGEFVGTDQLMSFQTASGVVPSERISLDADRQIVSFSTGSDTLNDVVPGVLAQTVLIGDRAYRLLLSLDAKGGFKPALAFERTAFVLSKGSLKVAGPGLDAAKLSLLLSDRSMAYVGGVSTLRLRILDGATVLMDRDFTALGGVATNGIDSRTGKPTIVFRTLSDLALTDRVALSYSSSKGAIKLSLSGMNLAAISDGAANLTFELTIGERTYTTDVTFFEGSPGSYGLAIP